MFSLEGKTVIVTGGGRGIGKGISLCMAKAGANVVAAGRSLEPLKAVAKEIEKLGRKAIAVQADVTKPGDIQRITEASRAFGYMHCWVNNAGSADPKDIGPLMDLRPDQWDRVVDLNMKWTFFAAQAAARAMTKGGSIINITSRSGSQPNPMTGQYGAAKAAIENLTATMAVEWGHLGIRVNAVAPGVVLTETFTAPGGALSKPSRIQRQIETVPLRRLGSIEDVGYAFVFLASDEAAWITGEVIQLTGGSRIPVGLLTYLHHVNERLSGEQKPER
jgi:3-oxoacyl-[acyl-carrier protein] reductase